MEIWGYAWKEWYCTGTVEATHEQVLHRYCRREGRVIQPCGGPSRPAILLYEERDGRVEMRLRLRLR